MEPHNRRTYYMAPADTLPVPYLPIYTQESRRLLVLLLRTNTHHIFKSDHPPPPTPSYIEHPPVGKFDTLSKNTVHCKVSQLWLAI